MDLKKINKILPQGEEVYLSNYIEELESTKGESYLEEILINCIKIIYQSICPGNQSDVYILLPNNIKKIIISNSYSSFDPNYLNVFLDYHLSDNNKSYFELGSEYTGASYLKIILTGVIKMFEEEMRSEYRYKTDKEKKRIKYFQLKEKKDKTDEEIKELYYLARDTGNIDFFTSYEEFLIENNLKEVNENDK